MNTKEPISGIKIYNVAGEKIFPEWMTPKQQKELKKDEDYENRIELLSNFSFPISSQRMEVTKDGKYLVVTGIYPPQIKVYELDQLSHHFTRCVDSEIIQMCLLSDDYSKLCLMGVDRSIGNNHFKPSLLFFFNLLLKNFTHEVAFITEQGLLEWAEI